MKNWQKILLVLLLVFVFMQLVPVDRSVPVVDKKQDFRIVQNPPAYMQELIVAACYDCHSYETKYPWYASIAPISFWLRGHINNGRKALNFSTWATETDKDHKLEECAEEIEANKMPLKSYTWTHPKAQLTADQKKRLAEWFKRQGE